MKQEAYREDFSISKKVLEIKKKMLYNTRNRKISNNKYYSTYKEEFNHGKF